MDGQFLTGEDEQKYKGAHSDLDQGNTITNPEEKREKQGDYVNPFSVDEVMKEENIYYDGFVIYNPNGRSDLKFVKKLADELEGPKYGLRLFIPYRDDLAGTAYHEITAEIIANRCKRAIVILSPSFLQSSAADFQLKFAQCLSPGARSKKVVPVIHRRCAMPNILKPVGFVDFTNPDLQEWNLPRLVATLKCPLEPKAEQYLSKKELPLIRLDPEGGMTARRMWGLPVATKKLPEH